MRSILIGAAALLLSGSAVAEPSVPTQLAETGAYLQGNAHRCGVANERVAQTETAIRDLIVSHCSGFCRGSSRRVTICRDFIGARCPKPRPGSVPFLQIVIARLERLEGYHQEAGY
jgi:hypothetical protein